MTHSDNSSSLAIALAALDDAPTLLAPSYAPRFASAAVCWSYGNTVGNTAPLSEKLLASLTTQEGHDVLLPCDFVRAGKYRHGASRWWCRTHQQYWGTLADHARYKSENVMCCELHADTMHYVVSPLAIHLDDYAEIGIWCSITATLSVDSITPHQPAIHVYARPHTSDAIIDADFPAVSVHYNADVELFGNGIYLPVTITPPSALAFVAAIASAKNTGADVGCVNCARCGYPHLDLGLFASKPHKKHYCGNCGYDSTHSKGNIISTPLKPLHDRFSIHSNHDIATNTLNLDAYSDCAFRVSAVMPAIIWKTSVKQQTGICVQVYRGKQCIIDNTFAEVIYQGKLFDRKQLLSSMMSSHLA